MPGVNVPTRWWPHATTDLSSRKTNFGRVDILSDVIGEVESALRRDVYATLISEPKCGANRAS
jgi:hypothetical protein